MPSCKCGYCTFVPPAAPVLPFPVRCIVDDTQARWGYVRGRSSSGDVVMTLIMTDDDAAPVCISYPRISETTNVVLKLCIHDPTPIDDEEKAISMWKACIKSGRSKREVPLSSLISSMKLGDVVSAPLPTTTSICRAKDSAPCCKKRRVSTSFAPLLPYDAKSMGGDFNRVAYLLGRFPKWNEEVVKELMRCDAYPLLHDIRLSDTLATCASVTCVHPLTGEAVGGVWLPMDLLLSKYSALVRLAKKK